MTSGRRGSLVTNSPVILATGGLADRIEGTRGIGVTDVGDRRLIDLRGLTKCRVRKKF